MKKLVHFIRLDGGTFARHLAVLAASLAAFFLRESLEVGRWVPWILGVVGVLNFLAFLILTSGGGVRRRVCRVVSPLVGVAGWSGLIAATGGAGHSPLVAGLGLEILLSAAAPHPNGVLAVTGASVLGLLAQELLRGAAGALVTALLQGVLLGAMGVVLWGMVRRWAREHAALSLGFARQERRLVELERELADTRRAAALGEDASRLVHGIKNAVHGLRGLTRLLERHLDDGRVGSGTAALLADLGQAIDGLGELARAGLGPGRSSGRLLSGAEARCPIEEALRRLAPAFPGMRWHLRFEPPPSGVSLNEEVLLEVTTNLVLNAAEAMQGRGEVLIEGARAGDEWRLRVTDDGEGVPAECRATLFRPGLTRKKGGSGLGLYVCRRLAEAAGGRIELVPRDHGASFVLAFPIPAEG